jgi:predicted enzyme related to lactoylglutathione lyase
MDDARTDDPHGLSPAIRVRIAGSANTMVQSLGARRSALIAIVECGFLISAQGLQAMSNAPAQAESSLNDTRSSPRAAMKFEVAVIPVADVDRAKRFYSMLGWRLDIDFTSSKEYRVVQFTPPGSACSIIFGIGITTATPGSVQGLHLIVSDIEATHADLIDRGVTVSEPFYDAGGIFHHLDGDSLVAGLHPQRRSYGSYASFLDPDGNGWILQEVTARLPGHDLSLDMQFAVTSELARALRRAAAAHDEHERRTGKLDIDWADWYAEYIHAEQRGKPPPS